MFGYCTEFNQPLDGWVVSSVTNMSSMFCVCKEFNQPLGGWVVSSVTNMSEMFINCKKFNQPLNNWVVSSVTNMSSMFEGCTEFNQPLNNWDVSSVTNSLDMFENCNITPQNKPRFNRPVVVDSQQIHRESNKINYARLNLFLKEKLPNVHFQDDIDYSSFINEKLSILINETGNKEEYKIKQRKDLERIMNERLSRLKYTQFSVTFRESIFYALNYVLVQPDTFKQMYLEIFLEDCINAYEKEHGSMTCAAGALERIVYSLVPACTTEEDNQDYITIMNIITANPNVLIPIYIQDWYKLHKKDTKDAFPIGTTEDEIKKNLKEYLFERFPNEIELINQKISEYADNIGYDEDSFMYGGKKRKTKKMNKKKTKNTKKRKQTNKKIKKTNKRKTKKMRK
jgi:surface protein